MIYSPYREGRCPTQREIDQDIKLISPITSRLHLYGMDCNQTSMVLSSINRLAPNMKLMIGMWVRGEGRFEIESKELKKVLDEVEYLRSKGRGREDNIIGICVGNEELFTKSLSKMELIDMLRKVKSIVKEFDLNIPVYTTEIPILWDHELAEESDAILLNIHPYFDQKLNPSKEAALRVLDQYLRFQSIYSIHNKPIIIGETGWPNGGQQVDNTGIPGFKEQESFFKKLICLCDYYKIHYYLFEAYDSGWKEFKLFNGVEKHFGLFSKDRIRHHQLSLRAEKACV
ncbi:glycoside hydrolase [Neoconidiobolus thromboides FSU 785]|nr:glycoside hydrolase [Neoconidiobolus thromboides FSU 785]